MLGECLVDGFETGFTEDVRSEVATSLVEGTPDVLATITCLVIQAHVFTRPVGDDEVAFTAVVAFLGGAGDVHEHLAEIEAPDILDQDADFFQGFTNRGVCHGFTGVDAATRDGPVAALARRRAQADFAISDDDDFNLLAQVDIVVHCHENGFLNS